MVSLNKDIRIIYIDPQSGGNLAMYDYELISRLENQFSITYIGQNYKYLPLKSAKFIKCFNYSGYHKIKKTFSYFKSLVKLLTIINRIKPDIIHIQWVRIPSFEYWYYNFIKKIFKCKIVYTVHNILPHVTQKYDIINYRRIYNKLADRLIVHTQQSSYDLTNKFKTAKDKVNIAPHGPLSIINDQNKVNEEILRLKKQYNLQGKIVFSLLGYQSSYKGSDLLIETWLNNNNLKYNSKGCLIIAGKFQDIKQYNSQNNLIIIPQKIDDICFEALIKLTDVMVLPYRRIEQSGLLLTLITNQIPYCATRVGELTYPIDSQNLGWIIENNDSLGPLLESIISNPNQIQFIKNNSNGWDKIKKHYDWDNAAAKTISCYKSLIYKTP